MKQDYIFTRPTNAGQVRYLIVHGIVGGPVRGTEHYTEIPLVDNIPRAGSPPITTITIRAHPNARRGDGVVAAVPLFTAGHYGDGDQNLWIRAEKAGLEREPCQEAGVLVVLAGRRVEGTYENHPQMTSLHGYRENGRPVLTEAGLEKRMTKGLVD